MGLTNNIKRFFSKQAVPEYLASKGTVSYWQELVMFWALFMWLTIGAFSVIPNGIISIAKGDLPGGLFRMISFCLALFLLFGRRYIKYAIRASAFSLAIFSFLILNLFINKNIVLGLAALYAFSIFASVMHDKKGKYFVIVINLIVCSVWGWLLSQGYYEQQNSHPLAIFHSHSIESSFRVAFNTFLITIIIVIPIIILIESLLYFSKNQKKMTNLLSYESMLLVESQGKLKRINDELDEFTYAASHDMKEPLRMITNYTQLLQKKNQNKLDEKSVQYLNYALENSVRMQRIIDDMLDYARFNKQKEYFSTIDATQILNEVVQNLEVFIQENKAEIKFGSLPEVTANRSQLFRLFQNLIENAIKFRKQNENPVIHINAEKKEKEIIFSVKDNGIGIQNEYLDQIFKAFKRLHKKEDYSGSGIGLSQCKKIVELHNGRIWAESVQEEGSVFYFSIPVKESKTSSVQIELF
ncbi:MAG: ATP-binding protein [Spirochaetia bacterium]|nr:ATP-binding protein [Spirochaetia bacterium]